MQKYCVHPLRQNNQIPSRNTYRSPPPTTSSSPHHRAPHHTRDPIAAPSPSPRLGLSPDNTLVIPKRKPTQVCAVRARGGLTVTRSLAMNIYLAPELNYCSSPRGERVISASKRRVLQSRPFVCCCCCCELFTARPLKGATQQPRDASKVERCCAKWLSVRIECASYIEGYLLEDGFDRWTDWPVEREFMG